MEIEIGRRAQGMKYDFEKATTKENERERIETHTQSQKVKKKIAKGFSKRTIVSSGWWIFVRCFLNCFTVLYLLLV